MKKSIFMAAMLLISAFGFAQKVKVVGLPGLDVQFKRCVVNGSEGYLDFLFTNVSTYDTRHLSLEYVDNYTPAGRVELQLYDDEGNILKQGLGLNRGDFIIGNQKTSIADIAKDVPVKVRIPFTNVDEYATEFKLFTLPIMFGQAYGAFNHGYIELRDITIIRRDQ